MFPWVVRSFSRSTQGAIHLSEESCTNSSCNIEVISFSCDYLSCDLKWCLRTCSHLYVLWSWLTAANRCTVLQSTWDLNEILAWLLLLSRAWSVFGKIVLCSRFDLYLILLNHVWLHLHENVRRHTHALNIWSWISWLIDNVHVEMILKYLFSFVFIAKFSNSC